MLESFVIRTREGGFIADDEGQSGAGLGEIVENPGDAVVVGDVIVGSFEKIIAVGELDFEERGFKRRDAEKPPAGKGHRFDGVRFGDVLRAELVEVGVEETLEVGAGFVGEDDGSGAESMAEGVPGGSGFSFEGDGAAGFFPIGPGGF